MDINLIEEKLNHQLKVRYFENIDSTNRYLMRNEDQSDLVIAANQSAGKGRYFNQYVSYQGGMYFSLKVKLPDEALETMNIQMALSVYDALIEYGVGVELKWLNDIYYQNRKVVGILCENSYLNNKYDYSVIGVGLNIYQPLDDLLIFKDKATHLFNELINQEELLTKIVNNFYYYLKDANYLEKYRQCLGLIDKQIRYQNQVYTVRGVSNKGYLLVEDSSGLVINFDNSVQGIEILNEY